MKMTLLLGALLLGPLGCAHLPPFAAPLDQDIRAQLGRVGVVTAGYAPEVDLALPPGRLDAAARGAGRGALVVLAVGAASGNGYLAAAAIGLSPLGAAVGALVGAGQAEPVENVKELAGAVRAAIDGADPGGAVRDALVDTLRAHGERAVLPAPVPGPAGRDERPDYRELAGEGFETALEIAVLELRLTPSPPLATLEHRSNPALALELVGRTRLVRTADGVEHDARTFAARGGIFTFAGWAADDARELRAGLDQAAKALAGLMAQELFGVVSGAEEPAVEGLEEDSHD